MKILVIEDYPGNQASARRTLAGHDVMICKDVGEGYSILKDREQSWDAVLTDLYLPRGQFRGEASVAEIGLPKGDLPAGLVFAIKAANRGINTVIVTDSDHHRDWICTILDLIGGAFGGRKDDQQIIVYLEARSARLKANWNEKSQQFQKVDNWADYSGPIIKNWLSAMQISGLFPELGTYKG